MEFRLCINKIIHFKYEFTWIISINKLMKKLKILNTIYIKPLTKNYYITYNNFTQKQTINII